MRLKVKRYNDRVMQHGAYTVWKEQWVNEEDLQKDDLVIKAYLPGRGVVKASRVNKVVIIDE